MTFLAFLPDCPVAEKWSSDAGLWISGSGNVQTPPQAELFFLPQKPYMPQGTLRHQLLYPSGTECLFNPIQRNDLRYSYMKK